MTGRSGVPMSQQPMSTRIRSVAAGGVVALALAFGSIGPGAVPAGAVGSPVVDLGLLAGGSYASASAINDKGVAAGVATAADGSYHVVRFSGGSVSDLGACCSAGRTTPLAINGDNEMASFVNAGYASDALYWDPAGRPTTLPALAGSSIAWSRAYDINNAGTIVGHAYDSANNRHAVIWQRSAFGTDLGFLGHADAPYRDYASARGINELGQVTGEALVGSTYHAFVYQAGRFTDLGPGFGKDLNDSGLVVGHYQIGQPAAWKNGVRTLLPSLWGTTPAFNHYVTGVNNAGDVVGYGPPRVGSLTPTAVLWRAGRAVDLGFFPGGDVSRAYGINNRGQVVGEGNTAPGGPMHALLWDVGAPGSPGTPNAKPTATLAATSPTNIPAGGSVTFRGSFRDPDNGPWSYAFTWGNGTTPGTLSAPGSVTQRRTFPTPGRYVVTFTVTDAVGASGASGRITVRVR